MAEVATAPAPGAAPPPTATPPVSPPSVVNAPEPGAAPPVEPPKEAAPAAGEPKAPEKKEEPTTPVAFAPDKLILPEGMKTDDPLFKGYAALMSDDKLDPQARGQKLLDLYANATKTAREAATEAWNGVNKEWSDKTLADPEIGGAKFAATKTTISKAIDSLGPALAAEVRQALDVTGAGNHPAIVKALHGFAMKLTEGGHVTGAPPRSGPPSVKDAFYPNSPDMK